MVNTSCLITGGAGFIGSSSCPRCWPAATGPRHRRLLDRQAREPRDLRATSSSSKATSATRRRWPGSRRGVVFHQAALPSVPRSIADPLAANESTSPARSTCCWRRAKRASSASSTPRRRRSTATRRPCPRSGPCRPAPLSPYAVAKLAGEHYCQAFCERLRPGDGGAALLQRVRSAAGSRRPSTRRSSRNFITAALAGERPDHLRRRQRSRATSATSTTSSRRTCWPATRRDAVGRGVQRRVRRAPPR